MKEIAPAPVDGRGGGQPSLDVARRVSGAWPKPDFRVSSGDVARRVSGA